MSKNKTHKGLQKRTRVTGTGLVRHRSSGTGHLKSRKAAKRLRQLRRDSYQPNAEAKRAEKLLYRRLRGKNQARASLRRSPSPQERRAMRAAAASEQQS